MIYEQVILLLGRYSRVGWIVALIVLALVLVWWIHVVADAQPDVTGTPEEIGLRWNRATQGLLLTPDGASLRSTFTRHLIELRRALDRADDDAAHDMRARIAEDFKRLRALRRLNGLDP